MNGAAPSQKRRSAWPIGVAGLLAGVLIGWWATRTPVLSGLHVAAPGAVERSETVDLGHSHEVVAPALPVISVGPARGVVVFIGDGMGLAHLAAARDVLLGPDGRLGIERLPVTGLVETHPARGLVTKSDASATAMASGTKTVNGRVGVDPDGRPLPSIIEAANRRGMATALVTTTEIVDATPASFGAHVAERSARQEIAAQLTASGIDVLLGAGARWFLPAASGGSRSDGRDLVAEARSAGWTVVRDAEALRAAEAGPLLGLFDFDLDALADDRPSLADMTAKTLDILATRPAGFLAVIEHEGTDTRSHRDSFATMARAVAQLDAAVTVAVERARAQPGILVLVTSDHETGGLTYYDGEAGKMRISWAADQHSGVPVPLFAYGPGAERFTGLLDNTDLPRRIGAALGFEFPPSP